MEERHGLGELLGESACGEQQNRESELGLGIS